MKMLQLSVMFNVTRNSKTISEQHVPFLIDKDISDDTEIDEFEAKKVSTMFSEVSCDLAIDFEERFRTMDYIEALLAGDNGVAL